MEVQGILQWQEKFCYFIGVDNILIADVVEVINMNFQTYFIWQHCFISVVAYRQTDGTKLVDFFVVLTHVIDMCRLYIFEL